MNYLPLKLEKLRKHYNYSQAYLAEVLKVDVIEYMGYENGRMMINYEQAKKLASLYHINIMEIFKNSDEVTLYDVNEAKTDELNIEYFIPKKTLLTRIKEKPLVAGAIFGVVVALVILAFTVTNKNSRPYVSYADNTDRLAVSETSVVYIDNVGAVKGSGDNANGQISNLPSESAVKVDMGSNFSVVLMDDGTVKCFGLISAYQKEIEGWKNILDIACGDNHVVAVDNKGRLYAVGDNSYGQLDISDFKDIKNVYASVNGTILVDNDGSLMYTGSFIGTSTLKKYDNILDVDTSDNNLIVLKEDGTCDYVASNDNSVYFDVTRWNNVKQVVCGDNFFACLKNDGTVAVASTDEDLMVDWKNIIAIDAGNDYLIGFDGSKIYGVGKNSYNQFEKEKVNKQTLPKVSNLFVDYDNVQVHVNFDQVKNASKYEVVLHIDDSTNETKTITETNVVFDADRLKDNQVYTVTVKAIGSDNYIDSAEASADFVYLYVSNDSESEQEEKITIRTNVVGSSKEDFETYLKGMGVEKIESRENEESICSGDSATVLEISGITPGSTYSRSELDSRNISYTYCKIDLEKNNEQQDLEN